MANIFSIFSKNDKKKQDDKKQQEDKDRPQLKSKSRVKSWDLFEKWPTQVFPDGYAKDGKAIRARLNELFPDGNYAIRWRLNHLELRAERRLDKAEIESLKKHYKDNVEAHPDELEE